MQSGTGTPLTSGNAALTGTISNGAVSLHEELGATLVGTIQGSDLIMQIPQPDGTVEPYMFHPGRAAEYNAQLQKLAAQLQNQRSTVTSQQQAAKTAQDQSNAGQSLANDLSKLGADEGAVSDANNALPAGKKDGRGCSSEDCYRDGGGEAIFPVRHLGNPGPSIIGQHWWGCLCLPKLAFRHQHQHRLHRRAGQRLEPGAEG